MYWIEVKGLKCTTFSSGDICNADFLTLFRANYFHSILLILLPNEL